MFTFADGTRVPKGTHISVAAAPRHFDENVYKNASEFDGFRFVTEGEAEEDISQDRFVSVSNNYLPFGLVSIFQALSFLFTNRTHRVGLLGVSATVKYSTDN